MRHIKYALTGCGLLAIALGVVALFIYFMPWSITSFALLIAYMIGKDYWGE